MTTACVAPIGTSAIPTAAKRWTSCGPASGSLRLNSTKPASRHVEGAAMTDTINVTKLRPSPAKGEVARPKARTAAERSRRYRKRKRAVHAVTPAVTVAPAVTVTPARHGAPVVTAVTLVAALALATVSAGFSITGMTSIFVGSFWPDIGIGAALETGKLSAVASFGQHGQASLELKPPPGILIA